MAASSDTEDDSEGWEGQRSKPKGHGLKLKVRRSKPKNQKSKSKEDSTSKTKVETRAESFESDEENSEEDLGLILDTRRLIRDFICSRAIGLRSNSTLQCKGL